MSAGQHGMAAVASSTPSEVNMDEEQTRVVEDRTTAVELEAGDTPEELIELAEGTSAEEAVADAQDSEVSPEEESGGDSDDGDGNMAEDNRHGEEEGTAAAASAMLQLEIVAGDEHAHVEGKKRKGRKAVPLVVNEEEEEENLGTEVEIDVAEIEKRMGLLYNPDLFAAISLMRQQPEEKFSRLRVPLCRMVPMPELRGVQLANKLRLQDNFQHGYRFGTAIFYIAMTGRNGEKMSLTQEIVDQWSPAWRQVNAEFEAAMRKDEALEDMCGKMFFIYDGNVKWKFTTLRKHPSLHTYTQMLLGFALGDDHTSSFK